MEPVPEREGIAAFTQKTEIPPLYAPGTSIMRLAAYYILMGNWSYTDVKLVKFEKNLRLASQWTTFRVLIVK